MDTLLSKLTVLSGGRYPEFDQRESGITHTDFENECFFYNKIKKADVEGIKLAMEKFFANGIVAGHLSDDSLRQVKYWAVCCVTLATRAAILGGLDEMVAYNLSDYCIMQIDQFRSAEEISAFLSAKVIELTELVRYNSHKNCSVEVRRCIRYIDEHLHEQIELNTLARMVNLESGYLSKCFKKQTGHSLKSYILFRKIQTAKELLDAGFDGKTIAFDLGFCSQSYFIALFRKYYGITPLQYVHSQINQL